MPADNKDARNARFWKMVGVHSPALVGYDPVTARANAESPQALFAKLNATAPRSGPDPTKLNAAAKQVLRTNATLMEDTFLYLYALTDVLKAWLNAVNVQYAPPKGMLRSEEKIVDMQEGYKGDATQLKDQVRCTIVCGKPLGEAQKVVYRICNEVNGVTLVKSNLDAHRKTTGYSDLNNVVRMPNDMYAEIQINSVVGLYAKEGGEKWMAATKQDVNDYLALARRIGIKGGLGHKLYEIGRDERKPKAVRAEADALAKEYYDVVMSGHHTKAGLEAKLTEFIGQHLGVAALASGHGAAPPAADPSPFRGAMEKLMKKQYAESLDTKWAPVTHRPRR